MASLFTPCLTDPDKLGLLIQCRQKMDELNANDLRLYSQKCLELLSIHQLKKLLFVGFNSIKNGLEYNQLFQMKSSINQIIEKAKKLKEKSNPTKATKSMLDKKSSIIPKVPKNASLSKIIPKDIISNNICQYLKMSSITNLAKCDRKLSVICCTPTSIKNLMHRYDPYKYTQTEVDELLLIDGHFNWNVLNKHKMQKVETLSIPLDILEENVNRINWFYRVKHLSFYDYPGRDMNFEYDHLRDLNPMPLLQTITFINIIHIPMLLPFLNQYQNNSNNHQLKSIGFIECDFDSLEEYGFEEDDEMYQKYQYMINFILPTQPNNLQVLKLENSRFMQTDHPQTNDANDKFRNMDRIKTSLSNLTGFVYGGSESDNNVHNQFFNLSRNILRNLISFKHLESIHTHSTNNDLISLYLTNNNRNALNKINEFCISVSMNQPTTSPICRLRNFLPNLEKLCLVINVSSNNDGSHITNFAEKVIKPMLEYHIKLKVFQIVAVMEAIHNNRDSTFCLKKINILSKFGKKLVESFNNLRIGYNYSNKQGKQALVFKFHVKSCHYKLKTECNVLIGKTLDNFAHIVQDMIINYLMTYCVGKIQFKLSWNAANHWWIENELKNHMKGLKSLCNIDIKTGGNLDHLKDNNVWHCEGDMDYRTFAISAVQKDLSNKGIEHENRWNVDCRYCCNTPWV